MTSQQFWIYTSTSNNVHILYIHFACGTWLVMIATTNCKENTTET